MNPAQPYTTTNREFSPCTCYLRSICPAEEGAKNPHGLSIIDFRLGASRREAIPHFGQHVAGQGDVRGVVDHIIELWEFRRGKLILGVKAVQSH